MENKSVWLSTTLFGRRQNWNRILRQIHILMNQPAFGLGATPFIVEFDYLSGESIHFSFLRKDDDYTDMLEYIDNFFKTFFLSLENKDDKFSLPSIFLPIPYHSIQYGIYPPLSINEDEAIVFEPQVLFSKIIIDAFSDEILADEIILAFSFYVLFGMCHVIITIQPSLQKKLFDIFFASPSSNNEERDAFVRQKFDENKKILFDIAEDIMMNRETEFPKWLAQWLAFCKKRCLEPGSFEALCEQTIFIVRKQLSLNDDMFLVLSCFIWESLQNFYHVESNHVAG